MKKYSSSGSEDGGCLNTGFAKRILSKTSLKSSSSSGKNAAAEEISKIHSEIDHLKQTIENLNLVIDDKDAAIGNLAREKEKLYVELKKVQRINRNIQQQLEDERDFYQKEKEHYCQEMLSLKRSIQRDEQQTYETLRIKDLEREIDTVQESLEQKDKIIYNLCVKYLRIRSSKASLREKMDKMNAQHHQAYDYIVSLLDASKGELDKLLGEKIRAPTTSTSSKKYLNLVRRNARLHYENTQLKIQLASLPSDKLQANEVESKAKRSKSDGKVPLLYRDAQTLSKVKRSIYTHSHGDTDAPSHFSHKIATRKGFNTVMFDYPRIAVQRPCSDPG